MANKEKSKKLSNNNSNNAVDAVKFVNKDLEQPQRQRVFNRCGDCLKCKFGQTCKYSSYRELLDEVEELRKLENRDNLTK